MFSITRTRPAWAAALILLLSGALAGAGCNRSTPEGHTAQAPAAAATAGPASAAGAPTVAHSPGGTSPTQPGSRPESAAESAARSAVPFDHGAQAFATVRDTLRSQYHRADLTDDELYRAAVAGMLQLLEPQLSAWNKLITPEELRDMRADLQGAIVGIGVEIRFDDDSGISDVLGVIPGSPAARAGIRQGDKILTVGGKLYQGKSLRDVVGDLRGQPGQDVAITTLRGGQVLSFQIRRERVSYDVVQTLTLPDGIGYLYIRQFSDRTADAVAAALTTLQAAHARALVIDLRGNQGGLFDKALATAELFLRAGTPIVTVRGRGEHRETMVSHRSGPVPALPIAILVDHDTASSGELLTGALHEGAAATVIGQRTFGKGTIQRLEELGNGYAYKFTTSHFVLPGGQPIEGQGVTPDVEVALSVPPSSDYERHLSRVQRTVDPTERLRLDAPLRAAVHIVRMQARK